MMSTDCLKDAKQKPVMNELYGFFTFTTAPVIV